MSAAVLSSQPTAGSRLAALPLPACRKRVWFPARRQEACCCCRPSSCVSPGCQERGRLLPACSSVRNMEPGPAVADHKSLVLALSRAGDWLKALQKRQREGLRDAQGSLDTSLAVLLREEERLRAQARGERARLQHELAALRAANEQAGRAAAATIQALQRQLGSLHTRLLAAPQPAEMAQEAAALLSHAAGLSVTLTWARLVPQPRVAAAAAAAAALGELRLQEEEVLSLAPSKVPARDRESILPTDGSSSSHAPGACKTLLLLLPGDHPPRRAGLALCGQKRSTGEGATLGPEDPSTGKPVASSLPAAVSGRGPLTAEAPAVAAAVSHSGRLALPAAMPLGSGSGPLFPAKAVLGQEDDSDSAGEQGGSRSPREGAEPGSRRGSWARAPADSLEAPSGVRPGPGVGRWVERGLQQEAERGSSTTSPEAPGASDSQVLRGARRGQAVATAAAAGGSIPPHQHQGVRFPGGAPSSMGWLPAQQAPARSLSAPPPPPCNRLVGQWGAQGSKQGQLRLPHGLHAAPAAGCLYVVDFGNRRLQELGGARRVLPLRGGRAYFDVAVGRGGCLALSNATGRCVELYSARGLLLQAMHEGFRSPRGIATSPQGEFLVADTHLGALHILGAPMTRGSQLVRRDTVRGFHKPYLVAASNARGEVAVSERGLDGGCCVKVLGPTWQVLRVLGGRSSPPVLTNPWGVSLDEAGRVLVADWGRHAHSVLCYPPDGHGWAVVTQGLSSPRGLALLGERHLVVADSMHHCLKTFQYC